MDVAAFFMVSDVDNGSQFAKNEFWFSAVPNYAIYTNGVIGVNGVNCPYNWFKAPRISLSV